MEIEIIEGNKLIAEFMGISILNDWGDPDALSKITYKSMLPKQLAYERSWDWLIPVVEKIESIYDEHHGYFGVHISSNSCSIQGTNLWKATDNLREYGPVYMSDTNAIFETKIKSTWYNVVQFIEWYNENIKKNPN